MFKKKKSLLFKGEKFPFVDLNGYKYRKTKKGARIYEM